MTRDLFTKPAHFDGATIDPALDGPRLTRQLDAVRELMADGKWRTLDEIAAVVKGSTPGISARLRDLRKSEHGSLKVERRRRYEAGPTSGVWEYSLAGFDGTNRS